MSESKVLYESTSPKTQSIEAVKALLAFVGRGADPLPSEISLEDGRLMLILSNKKDCYYTTTARVCSCPSAIYRPGKPCKHQRKYFPTAKPARCQDHEENLMSREPFKPVQPEYAEPKPAKASASSLVADMLIDVYAPVTTRGEIEYWQQKEKAMV